MMDYAENVELSFNSSFNSVILRFQTLKFTKTNYLYQGDELLENNVAYITVRVLSSYS